MSTNWYLIDNPYYTQGDEKSDFTFNGEKGLEDILTDTPLGKDVTLCKGMYNASTGTFETELTIKGIVQSETPDTQTKGCERQLLTQLNTMGDYKYVKYNGDIWLIMIEPTDNGLYQKTVIYLCNYILKWQDNDLNIITEPVVICNASQYNSGIEGNKTVEIGYNQLLCYTSMDIYSKSLNRTKRMFIDYNLDDPIPYILTRPDTVSLSYGKSRIMSLIFTEDQRNAQDRPDLMLCDYKTQIPQPSTTIDITYSGNPQIRSGGSAKTFIAVSDNPIALWEAIVASAYTDYVTVTPDPDNSLKCKVKCLQNDLMIGSTIRLKCTDSFSNTGELLVNIVGGV